MAEWRVKVHKARRRAFLTVLVAVRFRSCLKRQGGLRRIESFSYMIPNVLGTGEREQWEDERERERERVMGEVNIVSGSDVCLPRVHT